jgi:hypothetical protein
MLTFRARRLRELGLCACAVLLANCSGQKFEAFRGEPKSTADSGAGRSGRDSGGDTVDASVEGGARGSGGTSATGGQVDGGDSDGSSSVGGGTESSGGFAGSSQAGASGKGSGGRGVGGSQQSGGVTGSGGRRGSGGVIQTGGASPAGGAGGGPTCSGNDCAVCCDQLYPTMGGPTMTGSRTFSLQFYGCACSTVCYADCAASLCDSQDPHPAPLCLKCLQGALGGGVCQTSWTNCQQTKVCSNFGKCAFGCL